MTTEVVVASCGGSVGAVTRLVVDGALRRRYPRVVTAGTMCINVSGSLVLGVLAGLTLYHHVALTPLVALGVGLCGGYTTFSTASFEYVRLLQARRVRAAALSGVGTLVLGLLGAAIGMAIAAL